MMIVWVRLFAGSGRESCNEAVCAKAKEELDCERHFVDTYARLPTGEFSVHLPFKAKSANLVESYAKAHRRFLNLERKLERLPRLREPYSAFLHEYLRLCDKVSGQLCGHLFLNAFSAASLCVEEDSTTNKFRVVFDGSAITSSCQSLNEALLAYNLSGLTF